MRGRPGDDKARPDTVLFQAVEAGVASGADLVLCDTSGRLHTNWSLMDELAKCKRSIGKCLAGAPHEVSGGWAVGRWGCGAGVFALAVGCICECIDRRST